MGIQLSDRVENIVTKEEIAYYGQSEESEEIHTFVQLCLSTKDNVLLLNVKD